jgi:hypothetical protein
MQRSDEDELAYTHALIAADRGNFSAWHYRSLLLPRVHAARGHRRLEDLGSIAIPSNVPSHDTSTGTGSLCGEVDTCKARGVAHEADKYGTSSENRNGRQGHGTEGVSGTLPLYEIKSELALLHEVCSD